MYFLLFLGPVPPVRVTLKNVRPRKEKDKEKPYRYRRPPRLATLEIIERCFPPLVGLPRLGGSSGRVRPARPQREKCLL